MAELEVTVNGKPYTIKCDDGQEMHVARLADFVGNKVQDLTRSVGQVGDARLLLMACLLIADELSMARGCASQSSTPQESRSESEIQAKSIIRELDAFADRIEGIAASLEHA